MKVANKIAEFLRDQGLKHVFVVSGGASLHLIHGIADTEGIDYVCTQHEQSAGFAADCYARVRGLGCAIATSGPGATNFVTPIAASYYDSVPVLYITGNQTRERMGEGLNVRQYGFQATPIVEVVKSITKFAITVKHPESVIVDLQLAIAIMKTDRPGPVLVDFPDDIQRAEI